MFRWRSGKGVEEDQNWLDIFDDEIDGVWTESWNSNVNDMTANDESSEISGDAVLDCHGCSQNFFEVLCGPGGALARGKGVRLDCKEAAGRERRRGELILPCSVGTR